MLYLGKPEHVFHPFSEIDWFSHFMIQGDFLFAWKLPPIQYDSEKGLFNVYQCRSQSWGYNEVHQVMKDADLFPQAMWYRCKRVHEYRNIIINLQSKYIISGNSFMPRKEPKPIDFQPKMLKTTQLNRFIEFTQIFNGKSDITHFEQWCVDCLKLKGFTLKPIGPLNLFQFKEYKKVLSKDGEKEQREYNDSTLEAFVANLLAIRLTDKVKGLYGEPDASALRLGEYYWIEEN